MGFLVTPRAVNGLDLPSKICSTVGGFFLKTLIFVEQHYKMVQSVPYRLFELINNSRKAQGLQLYQLSISHWNQWGCWLKESLLPLAGHGGFELMKGCLLWTKFLHSPCHAPSLNFQMAPPDLDPRTMFLIHCAVIAALFFFPSCSIIQISLLEPLLRWSARYLPLLALCKEPDP